MKIEAELNAFRAVCGRCGEVIEGPHYKTTCARLCRHVEHAHQQKLDFYEAGRSVQRLCACGATAVREYQGYWQCDRCIRCESALEAERRRAVSNGQCRGEEGPTPSPWFESYKIRKGETERELAII